MQRDEGELADQSDKEESECMHVQIGVMCQGGEIVWSMRLVYLLHTAP